VSHWDLTNVSAGTWEISDVSAGDDLKKKTLGISWNYSSKIWRMGCIKPWVTMMGRVMSASRRTPVTSEFSPG